MAYESRPDKTKTPPHIRYAGRAALVSLTIAISTLVLANMQSPGVVTAALKMVFLAASSVFILALLLWVVFNGIRFAFTKHDQDSVGTSGDLW
jgi:hypothetical protein